MLSSLEKKYIGILIFVMIVCIILVIIFQNESPSKYESNIINKKIHIIHTSGTITGKKSLQYKLNTLTKNYKDSIGDYTIHEFSPLLESANITPMDWVSIGEYIANSYGEFDAFIVLHGSDTIAYTASGLSFMFENLNKPVVLTSMNNKNNIITALKYASQYKIPEVVVVFENKVMRGCRTSKVNSTKEDKFVSLNFPHLGILNSNIEVNKHICLQWNNDQTILKTIDPSLKVIIVKLFPGISGDYLQKSFEKYPVNGIVFELFGMGNAPSNEDFLKEIHKLNERGVLMVGVSQCLQGNKDYDTDKSLEDAGVIVGSDMTTEAAFGKILYLLSVPMKSDEAKLYINQSIRGELT
jgi:L-asparaginase